MEESCNMFLGNWQLDIIIVSKLCNKICKVVG
jgi:hypothetical protein